MYGTTTANDVRFALMHSFPHRFWNLAGSDKNKVVVQSSDSLHLMASVWDTETNTVLPLDVSAEISNADGRVTTTNFWPMISPTMGFHHGDNVALSGEGEYDVTLSIGPLSADRTTPFEGRFTESQSASMSFTFDTNETYNLEYRRVGDKAGSSGTVDLLDMDMLPEPTAPVRSALPGRVVGDGSSGDATFIASVVAGNTRFSEASNSYLIVSPRTPYNRVILPRMSLSATIDRGQETIFDESLRATVDPEISCFYGEQIPDIQSGDIISITPQAPPQLARHDGYETAFIDMPPIEFTV
ncbi:iron transporter [Haloarcula laminariae]|uniref:iron transporter n=1 Tax=Haloarcula laminariae TaxID=2961577 RepID=UPI0021C6827C|nr:iron transporter [Halomicroarcula laminariae]